MGPVGTWHFEDVFFFACRNICHMNLIFSSVWEGTFFESHTFCAYLSISQRPVFHVAPWRWNLGTLALSSDRMLTNLGLGALDWWQDGKWMQDEHLLVIHGVMTPGTGLWVSGGCYDPLKWRYIPTYNWVGANFVKIDKFSKWFGVRMYSSRSLPKHWMVTKEKSTILFVVIHHDPMPLAQGWPFPA